MIQLDQLPNQIRGEKTILFLRRHWVELIKISFYLLALLLVPLVLVFVLSMNVDGLFRHPFLGPLVSVTLSVHFMITLIVTLTQFTDYYLDTWIVTTERIISIEQMGLFSRVVSELHLNQVQDITSETHGMFATLFSYGDVYIQTAATRERFNFKTINNPDEVKRQITQLVNEDKRRHGDASSGLGVAPPPMEPVQKEILS